MALIEVSATSATTLPNQELQAFPSTNHWRAIVGPDLAETMPVAATPAAGPEVRIPAQPTAVTPEPVPATASGRVKVGDYFFPAHPRG